MKKTLIVQYTPRDNSNTEKLLDYFIEENASKTEVTMLDLTEQTPDLLLKDNLNAYVARNFAGMELDEHQENLLTKSDRMMEQVLAADYIVLATPMYNFSLPATVKAWIDVIIQAGSTFAPTANGLKGLCEGKQAAMLMTSGSDFGSEPMVQMNFAKPLFDACMGLMGIAPQTIAAYGVQLPTAQPDQLIANAKAEIATLGKKWY